MSEKLYESKTAITNFVRRNMEHLSHMLVVSSHPPITHARLVDKTGNVRVT